MRVVMLGKWPEDEPIGGVAVHMVNLVKNLSKLEGLELVVVSFGKESKVLKEDKSKIVIIKARKIDYIIPFISLIRLEKEVRRINPDILHIQGTNISPYLIYALFLARNSYIKVITVHGIMKVETKFKKQIKYFISNIMSIFMENYALSKIPNIIVVTKYVKDFVNSKYNIKSNMYIISNGVNPDYFNIVRKSAPNYLLFVGQVSPRKGIIDLIEMMKIVVKEIPDARLDIIGKSASKIYFKKIIYCIQTRNLTKNINLIRYLDEKELKDRYSKATLFVFPSHEESQGIVLLEAMASGLAIVASNIGGIPYVIEDKNTGLLFKAGDYIGLARIVISLLRNEKLREDLGQAGRKKATEYTWIRAAEETAALYQEVLLNS